MVVTRCTNNFGPFQYPGEGDPALHHEPARRASRSRSTATASTSATGSTSTTTARACTSRCRAGDAGEIYNIGAGNETPNRVLVDKLLALRRPRRGDGRVRDRPARPRPSLLRGHREDHGARLEAPAHARRSARPRRSSGTATNRWWWEPLEGRNVKVLVTGAGGQVGPRAGRRAGAARRDRVHPRRSRRGRPRRRARGRSPRPVPTRSCTAAHGPTSTGARPIPTTRIATTRWPCRNVMEARPAGRRVRGRPVHRLRVRRREGNALRRVGHAQPALGVRRVEARAASSRSTRVRRSCARRGCAVSTAPTR